MSGGVSKRFVVALVLALAAGLGSGLAIVGAHTVEHQQTVGYVTQTRDPGDRYKVRGDIGSLKDKCEPGRKVKFFRVKVDEDVLKGRDTTDSKGEFEFVFPNGLKSAMYYLRVAKLVLKSDGAHRHVCEGGQDPAFPAGNNP